MPGIGLSIMVSEDPLSSPPLRAPTVLQLRALVMIVFVSFWLGIIASHVCSQHSRQAECQRWRDQVNRWPSVVHDDLDPLNQTESLALALARGGMIAVRNQVCGY
jgi:hypothetical protein